MRTMHSTRTWGWQQLMRLFSWRTDLGATLRATLNPTGNAGSADRPGVQVWLVGAGSGDADLLTVKALRLIQAADAVVYDRLVSPDILDLIPARADRYYVGKSRGNHSVPQEGIGSLLTSLARGGKSVVRLKGGDPAIFSRMGEELAALQAAGIHARVVPGITAASAAAAGMGVPLTDRACSQQVRFVTAQPCRQEGEPDWAALARRDETLVFYMGLARVRTICHELCDGGLPPDWPVMIVSNASRPEQTALVGTLTSMPDLVSELPVPSPAIIVVGQVVTMARPAVEPTGTLTREFTN